MSHDFSFCPRCGSALVEGEHGGKRRAGCPKEGCGWVAWGNPVPVVAAIVEHQGQILLARGRGWPEKMFGLVTGFLEAGESPEQGVLREVKEELGLDGHGVSLVGVYPFEARNELIIAFHLVADGTIQLSDELEAVKPVAPGKLRAWPFGTGLAVQAWLDAQAKKAT
jgi:NADH pyrophosphatase NudC (nudix superfamily)